MRQPTTPPERGSRQSAASREHLRKRLVAAAAIVFASSVTGFGGASATSPPPVTCGQVITESTVLVNDVGPCPGDGVIIGADDITLDLNGRRIFGTPVRDDAVGVRLPNRRGVTVTGGEITGFGAGVVIRAGGANAVKRVWVHDNIGPTDFPYGEFGDGVFILRSPDNLLQGNTIEHNGPYEGIGVFGAESQRNRIVGNVVKNNNVARYNAADATYFNLDEGINLGLGIEGSSHTTIADNVIVDNGLNGINACSIRGNPCYTSDNVIVGNLIQGNGFGDPSVPFGYVDIGDGIHVVAIKPPGRPGSDDFFPPTRNLVARNRVYENAGDGIAIGASNNEIRENIALRNAQARRHFWFDLDDISLNNDCDSNVWRDNTFGTAFPRCVITGNRAQSTDTAPARTLPPPLDLRRRAAG
ncbi:MAG: right-handed parallel beta-helix repeat-containing protein [Actinomycetota bacterium]|nr:right-handed parallel beta-helix repeat-containing protein [Actinomycetota bacterium]